MSLKYCLAFLMLSAACVISGWKAWDFAGWLAIPLLYAAFTFFLLSTAYAGAGPALLLKRASGRQSIEGWILLGPYFLLSTLTFALYRRGSREPPFVQVAPNVFFGRRLSVRECPAGEWVSVLDLAAEFAEARPLRELAGYRSLPVLDATAPTAEQPLQSLRTGVRLNPAQQRSLESWL